MVTGDEPCIGQSDRSSNKRSSRTAREENARDSRELALGAPGPITNLQPTEETGQCRPSFPRYRAQSQRLGRQGSFV